MPGPRWYSRVSCGAGGDRLSRLSCWSVRTRTADIHPAYADIKVACSCGNECSIRSTPGKDLRVEICSACHPFYTDTQKIVDTGGHADNFRRRYSRSSFACVRAQCPIVHANSREIRPPRRRHRLLY